MSCAHHCSRSAPLALRVACVFALVLCGSVLRVQAQGPPRLLGWNDLGMHCLDADTSVFCILPPYNTIHAQLVVNGRLAPSTYTVTYEAVADPTGSINRTSIGKSDFWQHVQPLFGVSLPPDTGLAGFRMPGQANVPQPMAYHVAPRDWSAEGIPITPIDDQGRMRPYPLMRLVARAPGGAQVAATDVVLPVSAEMACVQCHGSGSSPAARPAAGWVRGPAATDDRINILRLHDDRHLGNAIYAAALQAVGYSALGLEATAVQQQHPVLCASCHATNALGAAGQPGVSTMTSAMHGLHASARLPDGRRLGDVDDRTSCYTCHPGAATRCLRGAMGKAIGADGEAMMSCQDCHGGMATVADPARTGWLAEPACQNCHTGDAVLNAGAIRFDVAFDAPGHLRTTTNPRFQTTPNVPQAGFSLYRFSSGHGGLQCSACHGSPHAIWPSSEANDNLQAIAAQGHAGTIVECSTCHGSLGETQYFGAHGMHRTGSWWVDHHGDVAENQGRATCQPCHGTNWRGTVLSRSQDLRVLATRYGTKTFWRGYETGCYDCHDGPYTDDANTNTPPAVRDVAVATPTDVPLRVVLTATDPDPGTRTLRIVDQPAHGAVAFDGSAAVYRARDGFVGADAFTYAAADGESNSNLGTVRVDVGPPDCAGSAVPFAFGCPLPDGRVPALRVDGCPTGGGRIKVRLEDGPATGFAVIGLGVGRGGAEIAADGCTLRLSVWLGTSGLLPLAGGTAAHALDVPDWFAPFTMTMQGFALTAAAPRGFVATPGLEVTFR